MANLGAGRRTTVGIQPGQSLTLATSTGASGVITRLGIPEGSEPSTVISYNGTGQIIGPFDVFSAFAIECVTGTMGYTIDGIGVVYSRLASGGAPAILSATMNTTVDTSTVRDTLVATIANVPNGASVKISPDNGTFYVAGNQVFRGYKRVNASNPTIEIEAGTAIPLSLTIPIAVASVKSSFVLTYVTNVIAADSQDGTNAANILVNGSSFPSGYTSSFVNVDSSGAFNAFYNDQNARWTINGGAINVIAGSFALGGETVVPHILVTRTSDGVSAYINPSIVISAASTAVSGAEVNPSVLLRDRKIGYLGDSILGYSTPGVTINQQMPIALQGRANYASDWNNFTYPGKSVIRILDNAQNGLSGSTADIILCLFGANGYEGAGDTALTNYKSAPTSDDWIARVKDYVTLVVGLGKRLGLLSPLSHPNDPSSTVKLTGRKDVEDWMFGVRTDVNGQSFDQWLATVTNGTNLCRKIDNRNYHYVVNDHPDAIDAALVCNNIIAGLGDWLDPNAYPLPKTSNAGGAVANPLFTGTSGTLAVNTSGVMADGCNLIRVSGVNPVASKTTLLGYTAQRITFSGAGISKLQILNVPINSAANVAQEAAFRMRGTGDALSVYIAPNAAIGACAPSTAGSTPEPRVQTIRSIKFVPTSAVATVTIEIFMCAGANGAVFDFSQLFAGPVDGSRTSSSSDTSYDSTGTPVSIAAVLAASAADRAAITPGKVVIAYGAAVAAETTTTSTYTISAPAAVTEGNTGTTTQVFTVARSGAVNFAENVPWSVAGSGVNPTNAADFVGGVLPSGTVSFASGQTSASISISIQGDTTFEPDETYTVSLGTPSAGGTVSSGSATATITNDDAATVSSYAISAPAAQAEGNSGTTNFIFTVARSGATGFAETLNYVTSGSGTNQANAADFVGGTLPSGTVSFASGQISASISIPVQGDTTAENNEGFQVTISNPSAGGSISTASASTTINDDDTTTAQASSWDSTVNYNSSGTPVLVYSNSNRTVARSNTSGNAFAKGVTAIPVGAKVHFAIRPTDTNALSNSYGFGLCDSNNTTGVGAGTVGTNNCFRGATSFSGSATSTGLPAYSSGQIIDCEVDRSANTIRFSINGAGWGANFDISAMTAANLYVFGKIQTDTSITWEMLPQSSWLTAATSGFSALA